MNCEIRQETSADFEAMNEVIRLAFGGMDEVDLVRNLRRDGDLLLSLVAESSSAIVGHIAFSRMLIDTEAGQVSVSAVSLAPVAVRPDCQRQGIGSALIHEGLKRLRQDESIVIVLGHPDYYPRFGFSSTLAKPIRNPFNSPDAWMALELRNGALASVRGCARYARAFGLPCEWTFLSSHPR
jgi:putative acetyltransferase